MNDKSLPLLKAFLWMICAFHVIVGIGISHSPAFTSMMARYYGAQVDWTPQFVYILKPLGAFMLVMGILAAAAARNPLNHRMVIHGFSILFAIRATQRLVFGSDIHQAFSVDPSHNLASMALFYAMAASLFLLHCKAAKACPKSC